MTEQKGTELWRVSGVELVEIKTHKIGDMVVTEEALRNIDPASLTGMKVLQGKTNRLIGYVEKAWKAEERWFADLRVFASVVLGFNLREDGQLTPTEVRLDCNYLDPG